MAGLQRFISYIYKYENDEKKVNVGFAKVEVRGDMCRLEVHIRNIQVEQPEGIVYLFARKENKMQGILVGSIPISRGNGDVRYAFETTELQSFGMTMEQAEGIYITLVPGYYLASQWKEGKIAESSFYILEKQENEVDISVPEEILQEKEIEENESITENPEIVSQSEDTIHTTEIPMEEFFEDSSWARVFQKMRLKSEIFYPFEGQQIECVHMEVKDIQEFPEKYWYLGNNSFLLHGFFQYGHFVIGKIEEQGKCEYFIGVPGVFLNQERIMAAMFGFPEFRTAKQAEHKTGNFGYWYRII
ncbi:MAG: hypothetical protein J6A75_10280 [Lachnospiraceae bacterium]|nr:hypothetical protein [Lachnospiraceae bacterium]